MLRRLYLKSAGDGRIDGISLHVEGTLIMLRKRWMRPKRKQIMILPLAYTLLESEELTGPYLIVKMERQVSHSQHL